MRILSLLILFFFLARISCVDPRACPIIELEHQLTPVEGQENTYRLTLINHDQAIDPEWIDLHMKVNDKDQLNIRVVSAMSSKQVSQDGIVVQPSDILRYYTTYSVDGTSCDSQTFEFIPSQSNFAQLLQTPTQSQPQRVRSIRSMNIPQQFTQQYVPQQSLYRSQLRQNRYAPINSLGYPVSSDFGVNAAAGACPAIDADNVLTKEQALENTYTLTFLNNDANINPDWVDIHLQVEGKEQMNLRLASGLNDKSISQHGIVILPGESIRYSSTYQVAGLSCDTPVQEYTAPINSQQSYAALLQQQQIPSQPQRIRSPRSIPQQFAQQYIPQSVYRSQIRSNIQSRYTPNEFGTLDALNEFGTVNRFNPVRGLRYTNPIMNRNTWDRQWNSEINRQLPIENNIYNNYNPTLPANMLPSRSFANAAFNPFNQADQTTEQLCPNIEFEQKVEKMINNNNLYVISFIDRDTVKNIDYVDLHYKVDGDVEQNVRLSTSMLASWNPVEKTVSQTGIYMKPGAKLRFYFTYAANGVACDSAHYVAQAF